MIRGRSVLTITNEIAYLPAIQSFAKVVMREIGFEKGDEEMILLALEEAVTNVISHAFEATEQSTFQIIFAPTVTGITIIIKDKGLPYDPGLLPEYKTPHDIEHMPLHGLGSFLMKECVDEVSFYNLGKEGKELHLVKHLPRRNIADYEMSEPDAFPEPREKEVSHTFELRLMKPSEAVEVSRLFYRTYEYSYLADVMYYPDRLAALNEEGLITSIVAVSDENEIVGHVAMVRETLSDTIAEAARGAVKASFRGHDLFGKMEEFLIDRAKVLGLKGIYGKAVTVHTYSQKMTEKTGAGDCAVLLGCSPADILFKGIAEKLPQRGTYVYSFLPLVDLPTVAVYPPPHHETIIRRIYSNLGQNRNFVTSPRDVPAEELSLMDSKIVTESNVAEIALIRYGRDCVPALGHQLRDLCAKKIDHVTLFLNLGDPFTGLMCGEFEKLGFVISGIIPCLHFGDTLMLQYLNNLVLDYSQIFLHSDMAKEILAYIKGRDPYYEA
jgi:anti-sigma regulatory factor (Ser/Thr protein kinase)